MDLKVSNSSAIALWHAREKVYKSFGKICEKNGAGRLLGLPLWVADETLVFTQAIADIGEKIFKGAGNLLAFPFAKNAKLFKGLSQISLAAYCALGLPIGLPLHFIISYFVVPMGLLIKGKTFANNRAENYEREAVDAKLNMFQIAQYNKWENKNFRILKSQQTHQRETCASECAKELANTNQLHKMEREHFLQTPRTKAELRIFNQKQRQEIKNIQGLNNQKVKALTDSFAKAIAEQKKIHLENRKLQLSVKELKAEIAKVTS